MRLVLTSNPCVVSYAATAVYVQHMFCSAYVCSVYVQLLTHGLVCTSLLCLIHTCLQSRMMY